MPTTPPRAEEGPEDNDSPSPSSSSSNSKEETAGEKSPPFSSSVKRLSEDNPAWRTYIPREMAEWLGLTDKDQIAWQRDTRNGKRIGVIWKRE